MSQVSSIPTGASGAAAQNGLTPAFVAAFTVATYHEMDRQRTGRLTRESAEWNVSGGPRVANLYREIARHVEKRKLAQVRVLNISGLNEGKPDPVLFDLLSKRFGPGSLTWSIIDHPQSGTFTNSTIRGWLDERGIECIAQDFRDPSFSIAYRDADIVLCTEIAEHLDYSVLIMLLRRCHDALRSGGSLIMTTPNAVFLLHRILFALGHWDFLHHMDDPQNVDQGLLGHIIYYDRQRLARLLSSLSFTSIRASTFNAGHGPGEFRNKLTRFAAISLRGMSRLIPNSGQVLLVTAERG